jgi:hypothetical protein
MVAPAAQWILPETDSLWPSRSARDLVDRYADDASLRRRVAVVGYEAPSLVFLLGPEALFGEPEVAASRLQTDGELLTLVGGQEEERTVDLLKSSGAEVISVGRARGFNYSKGRWVALTLYRARVPTP